MQKGDSKFVLPLVLLSGFLFFGCIIEPTDNTGNVITPTPTASITDNSDIQKEDILIGQGAEVKNGDKLEVNYTGTLTDGTVFDTSKKEGRTPFIFTIGEGSVIQGWDQGLLGMQVGGVRKLTIPSSLGYGESGTGSIPPNATLLFEVELLSINK